MKVTGQKSLVCLALDGGMDSNDILLPKDQTQRNRYLQAREAANAPTKTLALPPSTTPLSHPDYEMPAPLGDGETGYSIIDMFNAGKLKVIANVGTLVEPPYDVGSVAVPPLLLGAHPVQRDQWMSAISDEQAFSRGWGGAMLAELATNSNGTPNGFVFGRPENLLVGAPQMMVGGTGGILPYQGTAAHTEFASLLDQLVTQPQTDNVFELDYAERFDRAITRAENLNTMVANSPLVPTPFTFTDTYPQLGRSFAFIAQAIAATHAMSVPQRRIYVIRYDGWDTHSKQSLTGRLSRVSKVLGYFQKLLDDAGLADDVVTFTTSEFNRTLASNGSGTDHAWGGQSFVMGSPNTLAANSGVIGTMHDFEVGGAHDYDQGQFARGTWVPTTGVVQLAATLATWFGLSDSQILDVFPNLDNFRNTNGTVQLLDLF